MSDFYEIPANPEYEMNVRKLQNSDPASADKTFNPLFERIVENTHHIKEAVDSITSKKSVTFVVGTVKNGHAGNDVDYLCSGTDDQIVINQALAALPKCGGKVLLLEGDYHISNSIRLQKENVTLQGMGNATVLHRGFSRYLIFTSWPHSSVLDLTIEGHVETYPETANNSGIYIYEGAEYFRAVNVRAVNGGGCGVLVGAGHAYFENCEASNNNHGISFNVDVEGPREHIHIRNCRCNFNRTNGIRLNWTPRYCHVEGCELVGNNTGILVGSSLAAHIHILGCTVLDNSENGIFVYGSGHVISGNVTEGNGRGIELQSGSSVVTGNVFWYDGISNNGANNTVVNNVILENITV